MQLGAIQTLISVFHEAFETLHVSVAMTTLEDLAITVHQAMTDRARSYHRLEHVFSLTEPRQPVINLAALYHDVVYYQVDQGISPEIAACITPYIVEQAGAVRLADWLPENDRLTAILLEIFGFEAGEELSLTSGLNEFLSALFMVTKLGGILDDEYLVCIALCIEATIPFRGADAQGKSYFDKLEVRLADICKRYQLCFSEGEVHEAVQMAVAFSNKDVGSFADPDAAGFLANTWKLFLEMNRSLREHEVYSVRSYRRALQGMETFLSNLNPELVFHRYRGQPGELEFRRMTRQARQNIETARDYLRIKLLTAALLEALAEVSGGDAPLALFMGDIPQEGEKLQRLEGYLPEIEDTPWVDRSSTLYRVLKAGRRGKVGFDTEESPASLYLYRTLEPRKIASALTQAHAMFAGEILTEEFLSRIDRHVVSALARASAEMVFTRRDRLLKYVSQ